MVNFLIRVLINAVAIAITASLLPGITVEGGGGTLLIIGLVFGLVNAFIKPIVTFLTCPFVLITLGLFILVINGCMLGLTALLVGDRLVIEEPKWAWAIIGGIVMSIIGIVLESVLGLRNRRDRGDRDGDGPRIEYKRL